MARRRRDLFEVLGLSRLPWVTQVYLLLELTFASLVLLASLREPREGGPRPGATS